MASERLQAILELLGDEQEADRTLQQVMQDADLLRQVYEFARHHDNIPAILGDALLERYSTCLIEAFAAIGDLEEGLWVLPRLQHVLMDFAAAGRPHLDHLASAFTDVGDAGELGRRLGEDYCFSCHPRGHHDPANSFLPRVLADRCGLPLVVTALWLLLARRRGMEVELLVFPGRVYGRWEGGHVDLQAGDYRLAKDDLRLAAAKQGYHDCERFLKPATYQRILQRLCLNLAVTYRHRGDMLRCNLAVILGQMLG